MSLKNLSAEIFNSLVLDTRYKMYSGLENVRKKHSNTVIITTRRNSVWFRSIMERKYLFKCKIFRSINVMSLFHNVMLFDTKSLKRVTSVKKYCIIVWSLLDDFGFNLRNSTLFQIWVLQCHENFFTLL